MNVLFLTYSYLPNLGGVERSVHNLAELLIARGHDVTVATHALHAVPFRYRPRAVPPTLHLHVPSQTDPRPSVRAFRALMNPVNVATLAVFCVRRRIDVVHCHHLNTDTVYARHLARLLGVRFILTLRGGETEEWMHTPARRRYVIEQLRSADAVTAVSASLLAQAIALVPEVAARSLVIPNPVDADRLRATMAAVDPAPAPRPYVLFAGRLEPMKDVECLLDAHARAAATDPAYSCDLVIAGDGSLATALRARAHAGPAAARIRFLGRVAYPETLRWITGAAFVVLPSRCSEGCPNVVLEAMALGTPVVVSALASHTELVADGVTGRVVPVGDVDALHSALRALAASSATRADLAAAARSAVAGRHAGVAVVARYEQVYARPRVPSATGTG